MPNGTAAPAYAGGKIMDAVTNDGTDVTVYSTAFVVPKGDTWAAHIESDETVATYASNITLWASCKPVPSEADDTDWVQMVAANNWTGFPTITTAFTGGDQKDLVDVGVSGALWYRFKFVRTTGTALLSCWIVKKDMK